MKYNWIKILRWVLIGVLISLAIWFLNKIGIEQVREQVAGFGLWAVAIVFGLRFTSIIVPVLPGTADAILAGGLFGFVQGLLVVALADLASCTFNYLRGNPRPRSE